MPFSSRALVSILVLISSTSLGQTVVSSIISDLTTIIQSVNTSEVLEMITGVWEDLLE